MTIQTGYVLMTRSEPANGFPRKPKESLKSKLIISTLIWFDMSCFLYICIYVCIYMYIYMGNMFPETGGFSPPNMEVSDSIFTVQWFMMIQKWAANQPNWDTCCKNIDIHNQPNWVESMSLQKMRVPSDLLIVFPANMDH